MERQEETPSVPLIVARIQAPTGDLDEFVEQYCRYFGVDVVFLPTEGLQPPGRHVRFTFALADGTEVITGDGVVLRMRRDTGNPHRPPGMELRYQILDEASQRLVDRMIEARTNGGARQPEPPPYVSMWFEHEVTTPAWTAIAERKREETQRVPPLVDSLPANPFADVPIGALHYFIEWAIERAQAPAHQWSIGAYGGIPLVPPAPNPRRHGAMLATFSAGVIAGGAVFMLGGALAMRLSHSPSRPPTVAAASSSGFGLESGARAAAPALGVGGGPIIPVPETAPAPGRDDAAAMEALSIVSHPSGAWVRVDGQLRGRSPLIVDVAAGPHQVAFDRPRYAPTHVEARAPGRIVAQLERPSASLQIESTPAGARVMVDGHPMGVTPLALTTTAYERHRVQLELDGATVRKRPYVRPPGEKLSIEMLSR